MDNFLCSECLKYSYNVKHDIPYCDYCIFAPDNFNDMIIDDILDNGGWPKGVTIDDLQSVDVSVDSTGDI